jgi:phosphoserine aminotransferase
MSYSFAAGPARLPDAVLAQARETLFSRGADGAAPVERPFSAPQFRAVLAQAQSRLRALLGLPEGYRILFLAGGAMHQFAMVPANLATPGGTVAYADSGYWAQRAMAEAARQCRVCVVARHGGTQALAAPDLQDWHLPPD